MVLGCPGSVFGLCVRPSFAAAFFFLSVDLIEAFKNLRDTRFRVKISSLEDLSIVLRIWRQPYCVFNLL